MSKSWVLWNSDFTGKPVYILTNCKPIPIPLFQVYLWKMNCWIGITVKGNTQKQAHSDLSKLVNSSMQSSSTSRLTCLLGVVPPIVVDQGSILLSSLIWLQPMVQPSVNILSLNKLRRTVMFYCKMFNVGFRRN